jgi:hypothetical protein
MSSWSLIMSVLKNEAKFLKCSPLSLKASSETLMLVLALLLRFGCAFVMFSSSCCCQKNKRKQSMELVSRNVRPDAFMVYEKELIDCSKRTRVSPLLGSSVLNCDRNPRMLRNSGARTQISEGHVLRPNIEDTRRMWLLGSKNWKSHPYVSGIPQRFTSMIMM